MDVEKIFEETYPPKTYISIKLDRKFVRDYIDVLQTNQNVAYQPKSVTDAILYGIKLAIHNVLGDVEFAVHH